MLKRHTLKKMKFGKKDKKGSKDDENFFLMDLANSNSGGLATEKSEKQPFVRPRVIRNLWQTCCKEVAAERDELDRILLKLGLPPTRYSKDKMYPLKDYENEIPHWETCRAKDFLDFYLFPTLLPAIQALVEYMGEGKVLQRKVSPFNPLDFLTEYLYNTNPRYPERVQNPVTLNNIPFVQDWLEKYPRPPLPLWMTLSENDAAIMIQKCYRGYRARNMPLVIVAMERLQQFRNDKAIARLRKLQMEQAGEGYQWAEYFGEHGFGYWEPCPEDPQKMCFHNIQDFAEMHGEGDEFRKHWNAYWDKCQLEEADGEYAGEFLGSDFWGPCVSRKSGESETDVSTDKRKSEEEALGESLCDYHNILSKTYSTDALGESDDGELDNEPEEPFHSDTCLACKKFREFMETNNIPLTTTLRHCTSLKMEEPIEDEASSASTVNFDDFKWQSAAELHRSGNLRSELNLMTPLPPPPPVPTARTNKTSPESSPVLEKKKSLKPKKHSSHK